MKINPHIFRGYDLRGLVDNDLNSEIVEHLGKAYGTYMKRNGIKKAVVGFDCRATSEEYADALIKGFSWAGIDTINIGMNLVGTFYWAQYYLKAKGGTFVTASHNPAEYNGFKFANDYSETLVSDGMQELRRMVEEEDYEQGEHKGKIEKQDIRAAYFEDIIKKLPVEKKFKVVIDSSCSTAGVIAPDILRQIGCEVIESNCAIDPTFPLGTPDPTEMVVAERLKNKILEVGADLGFSYDADGDRIGIVDDKGEPFMWRTGHSFIKKKNQEIKAAFIGELSGHFFFSADFYNHDDGLYSTLRLLHYLSRTNQSLSEAIKALPKYISSPEIKVGCGDDVKVALMDKIAEKLRADYPQAEVIDDERAGDGVRLEMEDSMFIVRYSQNGPYLTVKFEAKTQEKYNELRKYISELLYKYEEVDWSFGVNVESLN